jgi:hypothetical protein
MFVVITYFDLLIGFFYCPNAMAEAAEAFA